MPHAVAQENEIHAPAQPTEEYLMHAPATRALELNVRKS